MPSKYGFLTESERKEGIERTTRFVTKLEREISKPIRDILTDYISAAGLDRTVQSHSTVSSGLPRFTWVIHGTYDEPYVEITLGGTMLDGRGFSYYLTVDTRIGHVGRQLEAVVRETTGISSEWKAVP